MQCTCTKWHSEQTLTWHDGIIPFDEIWVKIGGDKGGKSMKASFQLCNVSRPNAVQNTCVFSVFEARDSPANLHIAGSLSQPDKVPTVNPVEVHM